ncbi:ABC transporter substrate-binding protein [Bradyrhizobium erythrophlei]|uniref:Putative ABC transport system substrate-binding protein n=1 Tax=Bradyrhizobium erythrophlei TaxID=1437360 RepID=A0A1M5LXV5_9BRAD|nr:ABC transporter substrate-binding protein [Bradyrhizobium erythrophlei]SHG69836.1 putative ABC transport system substrate-binding protein [Bradyrhizobium erythrophlei]HEV3499537.1 ABC transporter substrate-binding protein [Bradyrhizobium sp.]
MRRRAFIALLGGAAVAASGSAHAQQDRVRRIGVLMGYAEADSDTQARMAAFRNGLDQLGWKDGRNIQITFRFGVGEMDRVREFAKQLIDLNPDVIVCETTPTLKVLAQQTATLPIVFVSVADPLNNGYVAELAHPGGHITGFTNFEATMGGKWIELLKKIAPATTRIGVIFNPDTAPGGGGFFLKSVEASAPSLAATVISCPVHSDAEIESAIIDLGHEPGGGLIVMLDVFTAVHRPTIISQALANRVPTIFPWRFGATDGGLVSYGVDVADLHRRAAAYVDRILKGTKPADLPVQQPTKFELVINLKTAKALGIEVSPTLLATADEIIE